MNFKITLLHVEFIPKILGDGVLYVSKRFKVAAHNCPCGCENKIITPLGPHEWSFSEKKGKPFLSPSIGNWQIPCRSHYWIKNGNIEWSISWSEEKIQLERSKEQARLKSYYHNKTSSKTSTWQRIKNWIFNS